MLSITHRGIVYMRIKFSIDSFNPSDPVYSHLSFGKENEVSKIYRELVETLNEKNFEIDNNISEAYPNIKFPEEVEIKIFLIDKKEVFAQFFDSTECNTTLGVFRITNGNGLFGNDNYTDDFSILVDSSMDNFNKLYNMAKPNLPKKIFFENYLITLTHEISHALEFLENGGGLTPHQVELEFDKGNFDYTVEECAIGYNFPKYYDDYLGLDNERDEITIIKIMEERVEAKGIQLFKELNYPKEKINKLFKQKRSMLNK